MVILGRGKKEKLVLARERRRERENARERWCVFRGFAFWRLRVREFLKKAVSERVAERGERERFERRGRIPWTTVRNSGVLEFELR